MKLEKISRRVYANTEGKSGGNVGIIVTDRRVIAVDSQYPMSGADFRKSILEITPKPVTHLLLTHVHGDHVFGNQHFEDTNIVSDYKLKEKMQENLKSTWSEEGIKKMLDDVKRNQPERIHLYQGIRIVLPKTTFKKSYKVGDTSIVNTGGHTDCSSYVYVPEDKVLFAGDNLFIGRFPWAGDPTVNPDHWIKALSKYIRMDVQKIVPGHGPLCDKSEVERQLKWFKTIRRRMKLMINKGIPDEDIVNAKYPELYPSDRPEWVENSFWRWLSHWKA
jgi:glyoxylase-like metal-dependent hydrolase (beta-lactamase superfamily II)